MVAFELAQLHEKAGVTSEAVRWFTTAAERFRRPQWKQKAEEGLVRLGAPIPAPPAPAAEGVAVSETTAEPVTRLEPIIAEFSEEETNESGEEMSEGEQESVFEQPPAGVAASPDAAGQSVDAGPDRRRRRRGRRGGRGRHKGARTAAPAQLLSQLRQPAPPSMFDRAAEPRTHFPLARPAASVEITADSRVREPEPARDLRACLLFRLHRCPRRAFARAIPRFPRAWRSSNPSFAAFWLAPCIRWSRPTRRPPGPASSSSRIRTLTTYYYAESCQTLRVGIGNMLRSGRGSREGSNLKEKLAEHLGHQRSARRKISERPLRRALAAA
jgi:hypothetical protein